MRFTAIILVTVLWFGAGPASASRPGSKLLATGGVSQFEGAAGGGLTPWALIGGYGTQEEIGLTAFATALDTGDYGLGSYGIAIGFYDRLELSLARQRLAIDAAVVGSTATALVAGLSPLIGLPDRPGSPVDTSIRQDVLGLKLKLFGDAIYAQDTWLPQVSLGMQHKRNRDFAAGVDLPYLGEVGIPALLGAASDQGNDYYLSATKVILGVPAGRNLLLSATLRATRANAFGLLGFGRRVVNPLTGELLDEQLGYSYRWEGSAALFLDPHWVLGAEFRTQGNRLDGQPVLGLLGAPGLAREDTAWDLFVAYVPNKRIALTAAYLDLGNLPFQPRSTGWYLSLHSAF